jgi:hypothetical protein
MLALFISFGAALTAFFVIDAGPALAVFPLAITAFAVWLLYSLSRGYGNPDANFVVLGDGTLQVHLYEPLRAYSRNIAYALMDRAYESPRHASVSNLSTWPFPPSASHVDIALRRRMWLFSRYSILFPWVRVVHLDVADRDRFLQAVRAKVRDQQ